VLIPVSIAYDQIQDVQDYAAEQRGAVKPKESFGWFVGVIRRLRSRYGNIHIDFGEPLSLANALGPPDPGAAPDPDERNLALQKLAFEVCVRINQVTPITPISLVTLALLGTGGQAETVDELMFHLRNLLRDVRRRRLSTTGIDELETPEGVERSLEALVDNGVVTRFSEGSESVYWIGPDQQLAAAYYRNAIIHFFVNPAIAELALLQAAEPDDSDDGDRVAAFWRGAMQLRDLLKFEFFFAEKDLFRSELHQVIAAQDPDWERTLERGPDAIQELLRGFRPFSAHRILRPFLEAYRIVADRLERADPAEAIDHTQLVRDCIGLGQQYHLQRRIRSTASVSQVLFQTALKLADNRGLVRSSEPDLASWRKVFADEIRVALRRIDAIDALAASRRAGLID